MISEALRGQNRANHQMPTSNRACGKHYCGLFCKYSVCGQSYITCCYRFLIAAKGPTSENCRNFRTFVIGFFFPLTGNAGQFTLSVLQTSKTKAHFLFFYFFFLTLNNKFQHNTQTDQTGLLRALSNVYQRFF